MDKIIQSKKLTSYELEIENFLKEKNNKMKQDVFISEAIDNGFRISKKPTQDEVTNPEILTLGFSEEHRKNMIKEMESTPQFVLVNPENKMVIELFVENEEVKQANAVFKYSFPVDRIEDTFDITEQTRGLGIEKFQNGKMYRTESVMIIKEGELTKLNSTLNDSKVNNEKFSFSKDDLDLFISMKGKSENSTQVQFGLSKILGNFNANFFDYLGVQSKTRKPM